MTSHNTILSSNLGDDTFDGPRMNEPSASRLREGGLCQTTIDMLPDNVLLEIFDFYRKDPSSLIDSPSLIHGDTLSAWKWQRLAHVCRRWRDIVFGSPRRLELQVICTPRTPTRTSLDIWPPFPIVVIDWYLVIQFKRDLDNIIAAVERCDRISHINIQCLDGSVVERLTAVMQEPFPLLTTFHLLSSIKSAAVLPEAFLGGSAPLLEAFVLYGISFPTFPKFILSAIHIRALSLSDIPHSGYIPPQEMATCLAALPNLQILTLGFRSPLSRPLPMGLPPLTRAILPALTHLSFRGTLEYFEDFLARTHIPLLMHLGLHFFMDLIFDIPRLHRLIIQTEGFGPLSPAWVMFTRQAIAIRFGQPARIELVILCQERDWQLLSLAHACGQHLPLSNVEQLSVCELDQRELLCWEDDMDSSQWFELLRPFVAVRNLYVSKQFVPFVAAALQELTGEWTMEVLPDLNNLFLEGFEPSGPVQEAIKPFVSARQLSGHPIVIHSEPPHLPPPLPGSLQPPRLQTPLSPLSSLSPLSPSRH